MLQLAIWLVLTEEGLVASLQHWDWLIQDRLASLLDLPVNRYQLISVLPVGEPAEPARDTPPVDPAQILFSHWRPVICQLAGSRHPRIGDPSWHPLSPLEAATLLGPQLDLID